MEEQRILVVLPHPDDEAFGLSGTLAKLIREEGARVTYACLTLGQMGRNMGVPPFASRVSLPDVRRQELEESCRAIGIQDLRMLGFHDKTLEFEERELLDGAIAELLKEVRPTLVYTFYPGYSVHPDHDATGAAVVRAVGELPSETRPPVHCVAFAKNTLEELGPPDLVNNVGEFMEAKLAAIYAHRSQFQAAELVGNKSMDEIIERFGTERFWIYRFEN